MPAHHAQRRPVVVANARHSPLWLRFAPRPDAFRAHCSVAPEKLSGSEAHQAAQTRRVNNANIRWPIQASSAPTPSQRANRVIIALPVIATKFVVLAMVGRQSRQL